MRKIGWDAYFENTKINRMDKIKRVGGFIRLKNAEIKNIENFPEIAKKVQIAKGDSFYPLIK